MKVQVLMQVQSKASATETQFGLVVGARDTVAEVKKRILDLHPNAFPDQTLTFNGRSLENGSLLSDVGVAEGGELRFTITPSEDAFCEQLGDFLKQRPIAPQELALLYCHKYCMTVAAALSVLGFAGDFQEFLQSHKKFNVDSGMVSAIATEPAKPVPLDIVVVTRVESAKGIEENTVELKVQPDKTVQDVKMQISAMELLPFPDQELLLDGNVLDNEQTLSASRVNNDSRLVLSVIASTDGLANQLVELLREMPMCMSSTNELSSLYCYRYGSSLLQALRMAGWTKNLRSFFESSPQFSMIHGGCVTLPGQTGVLGAIPEETIEKIVNAVLASSFLNVDHISKGSYEGTPEVVLHLNGLPPKGYDSWKSGLLNAAACALTDIPNLSDAEVADDALQVRSQCGTSVVVRLESTAVAWAY